MNKLLKDQHLSYFYLPLGKFIQAANRLEVYNLLHVNLSTIKNSLKNSQILEEPL